MFLQCHLFKKAAPCKDESQIWEPGQRTTVHMPLRDCAATGLTNAEKNKNLIVLLEVLEEFLSYV